MPRDVPPRIRRIAILGNENVGKTTLFRQLCRGGEHSVNIPGSTQIARRGVLAVGPGAAPRRLWLHRDRQDLRSSSTPLTQLYDTPGSASLAATSEDEMVGRDLVLTGQVDGVLLVADAKNLRRSLALALQVAEFGLPMVLDLNMLDEAESMGVEVDAPALSRQLGVEVTRTIAVEDIGVRRVAEALMTPRQPTIQVRFPDGVEDALSRIVALLEVPDISPRGLAILLFSGDAGAEVRVAEVQGGRVLAAIHDIVDDARAALATPPDQLVADTYLDAAREIVSRTVTVTATGANLLARVGTWAQRPFPGLLIALGVIVLAWYWVGAFGATFVADSLATYVFDGWLVPLCERAVAPIPSAFVREAIMDPDFGLLPTGLFLALGLVLPVLFCFYLLQAILEDSGYLPRLSVLFDRVFRWMGLNGQGLIPLVLGFSCVTMAVITARMLPSRRERIILTTLLMLGLPCAPMLAVMFVILADLPWTASAVIFGLIISQSLLVGHLASRLLPGELPDLILEIPRMRMPRPRVVLAKTWRRTWLFMKEAVPIFLLASFVVFVFDRIGGLDVVARLSRPLVNGLLGLPDGAVQVFIKTAIRREAGAAELDLISGQFEPLQLVVSLVVMTFLLPCINSIIIVIKERGVGVGTAIMTVVVAWALVMGVAVNVGCRVLGVTFGG